jgi:hypothetical protein
MAGSVRVTGVAAHLRTIRRITSRPPAEADKALQAGATRLGKTVKQSIIQGAVSGRRHVPSKPGEPPNADTHVLDRSIHTVRRAPYKVDMIEDAPYSVHQEYGTLKMAARPHVRPAVQRERAAIIGGIVAGVHKGVA